MYYLCFVEQKQTRQENDFLDVLIPFIFCNNTFLYYKFVALFLTPNIYYNEKEKKLRICHYHICNNLDINEMVMMINKLSNSSYL